MENYCCSCVYERNEEKQFLKRRKCWYPAFSPLPQMCLKDFLSQGYKVWTVL